MRVRLKLRVQRIKHPTGPATLGLEKACLNDSSRVPTLLLLHLSDQDNPWYWVRVDGSGQVKVGVVFSMVFRGLVRAVVRVVFVAVVRARGVC